VVRWRIPAGRHETEQVIDRSRFRCTIERVTSPEAAGAFVRSVQQATPDATHHCWAFVAGPPGGSSHIGLSDDGEPHGTAGRPMLTVLLHSEVGEIAAVVTRWYGGVKLGTGGLARAYSGAVQQALASAPLAWRVDAVPLVVRVEYGAITPVRALLEELEGQVQHEEYAALVRYEITLARDRVEELARRVADLTRGRGEVMPGEADASRGE
jgi:uncharacterized YigZ family protein